jgi:signal transduction histidine kinase/CheY-like chemotaxis protein
MNRLISPLRPYLIAVLVTSLVVLVGWYFFEDNAPLLLFIVPVIAAWSGGLLAGLFATGLCVVVGVTFFMDHDGLYVRRLDDRIRIVVFVIFGAIMSWLIESLHVARRRLEERQRQLVHEVSERREMERALRDADRRKDEFLATLAHELRNPLTPLSYALQLWPSMAGNSEDAQQLWSTMDRQVQQMTRLINDLMDVARITRGRIPLQRERVAVETLVSEAVEAIKPLVESRGHELIVKLPQQPAMVDGDAARLTQALGNILHNAVKYTDPNSKIWVEVEHETDKAVIRVRDNGPGIPPHMLSEIFEMFRQVDQTLDRSHGGLGIGLTLVKKMIEVHGGSIEARSEGLGKGSEFIVSLPLLPPLPERVESESELFADASSMPRHRILVVDDFQESAQTLAAMLRSIGQEVLLAHDGTTAFNLAMANKPSIAFLDIAMPGMDGYELARQLRSEPELRGIWLAALTGYGQDEDRVRAYKAGFNHHITKPAKLEALKELLHGLPPGGDESAPLGSAVAAG